jgi:feruloyl esterase
VRLPDVWKQRYVQYGGGGFDGSIPNLSGGFGTKGKDPVTNGYVVAADNGGHRASDYPGPSFAVDRALTLSYATTKIFDTHMVAEALTQAYYGKLARYSYFTGCSNGGKNASVAAANFGQYFDGIIGGDGVWGHAGDNVGGSDMAGLTSKWSQSVQVGALPAAKGAALYNAIVAACDSLDGVADGIVSNPSACPFGGIVSSLRCTGADDGSCLTDADIAKVNAHTSPLTLGGRVIGAPWAATANLANVAGPGLAAGFLAMAFRSPTPVDPNTYNIPAQFDDVAAVLDGVYSMTGNLKGTTDYLDHGGKLILFHGWEDTTVPSYVSVNFFHALQATDRQGSANTRLFMGPGVQHCQNGPGPDSFDMLSVMANWVEHNAEPGSPSNPVIAWKAGTGSPDISGATFTRPLCPYPRYPRYVKGNPSDAGSYSCKAPRRSAPLSDD